MTERFWKDIETGDIYDDENNDFEPVKTLNKQSDEIQELKQQLAEKDKEIAELNSFHDLYLDPKEYSMQSIFKQIRHQVCDEIRKWAEENKVYCDENNYDACLTVSATNSTLFALKEFLSEIEKGE